MADFLKEESSPINIKSTMVSVGVALQKGLYNVPLYQRSYCWAKGNVEGLLVGIRGAKIAERPYHYLGSIVLLKPDSDPTTSTRYDIVDGQQRLTTLIILLSAARQILKEGEPAFMLEEHRTKAAEYLSSHMLRPIIQSKASTLFVDRPNEPVIKAHGDSRNENFFSDFILKKQSVSFSESASARTVVQQLYVEHFNFIKQWLLNLGGTEKGDPYGELWNFTAFVLEKCCVAVIEASALDEALTMFDTLNIPGQQLRTFDRLKAHIVAESFTTEAEKINFVNKWNELVNSVGDDSFEDVFEMIREITVGPTENTYDRLNLFEYFRAMSDRSLADASPIQDPNRFIELWLEPFVQGMVALGLPTLIRDSVSEDSDETVLIASQKLYTFKTMLRNLDDDQENRLENVALLFGIIRNATKCERAHQRFEWLPCALLCTRLQRLRSFPASFLVETLELLEAVAGIMFVLGTPAAKRSEVFKDFLKRLQEQEKSKITHESSMKKLRTSVNTTLNVDNILTELMTELPKMELYGSNGRRLRGLYMLLRAEASYPSTKVIRVHTAVKGTIEHILPQNPRPQRNASREDSWYNERNWTDDQRTRCLHLLGNLTLLDQVKNSSASNYVWEDRKNKYFYSNKRSSASTGMPVGTPESTGFKITDDLKREKTWKYTDFVKRHYELCEKLWKNWWVKLHGPERTNPIGWQSRDGNEHLSWLQNYEISFDAGAPQMSPAAVLTAPLVPSASLVPSTSPADPSGSSTTLDPVIPPPVPEMRYYFFQCYVDHNGVSVETHYVLTDRNKHEDTCPDPCNHKPVKESKLVRTEYIGKGFIPIASNYRPKIRKLLENSGDIQHQTSYGKKLVYLESAQQRRDAAFWMQYWEQNREIRSQSPRKRARGDTDDELGDVQRPAQRARSEPLAATR